MGVNGLEIRDMGLNLSRAVYTSRLRYGARIKVDRRAVLEYRHVVHGIGIIYIVYSV